MPQVPLRRGRSDGGPGQGRGRSAERGRAAQRPARCSNLEVQQVKQKRSSSQLEITPQKVRRRDHALLAPAGGVRAQPASRSLDGLEVIAEGTTTSASGRSSLDVSESSARASTFSDALAAHNAVFPPYYLGILRSAELTGQPRHRRSTSSPATSSATSRPTSKIKSALTYPSVVARHVDRHRARPGDLRAAEVRRLLRRPRRRAAAADADAARLQRSSSRTTGACSCSCASSALGGPRTSLHRPSGARRIRDRVLLTDAGRRRCRALLRRRALLPHPRRDDAAGVPLPERMAAATTAPNNTRLRGAALRGRARSDARGRGLAGPIARDRAVPAGRDADDARRREHRNARPAARERGRTTTRASSTTSSSALTTLFEPAVIVVMGLIVGFVAVALVQAMYGIYNSPAINHI